MRHFWVKELYKNCITVYLTVIKFSPDTRGRVCGDSNGGWPFVDTGGSKLCVSLVSTDFVTWHGVQVSSEIFNSNVDVGSSSTNLLATSGLSHVVIARGDDGFVKVNTFRERGLKFGDQGSPVSEDLVGSFTIFSLV